MDRWIVGGLGEVGEADVEPCNCLLLMLQATAARPPFSALSSEDNALLRICASNVLEEDHAFVP
ncbi:hypothetical protein QC762_0106690 [Podospora pseudocomata]|uniref:Uncharacterized protein n=1 Tax=Podospora pseudocomata TaxID=2093779 RepID=A0ABR0G315_9PEZI|nr:hypothetical protein QC762_0106690 [Podospora pseudocomata]